MSSTAPQGSVDLSVHTLDRYFRVNTLSGDEQAQIPRGRVECTRRGLYHNVISFSREALQMTQRHPPENEVAICILHQGHTLKTFNRVKLKHPLLLAERVRCVL